MGWLDGDDDSCFDLVIGSRGSGDGGRVGVDISGSSGDENGFRDGLRIEYVRSIRRLVDPFVHVDVGGCRVVDWRGFGWTPESLRIVADYLDELNVDWYRGVGSFFDGL
jgi:hypothetical protein